MYPKSGLLNFSLARKAVFLVVEQKINYLAAIQPFQKYVVSTSISVSENKWLIYEHIFEQEHPAAIGDDRKIYAKVFV